VVEGGSLNSADSYFCQGRTGCHRPTRAFGLRCWREQILADAALELKTDDAPAQSRSDGLSTIRGVQFLQDVLDVGVGGRFGD
jgi:hypothetical protein